MSLVIVANQLSKINPYFTSFIMGMLVINAINIVSIPLLAIRAMVHYLFFRKSHLIKSSVEVATQTDDDDEDGLFIFKNGEYEHSITQEGDLEVLTGDSLRQKLNKEKRDKYNFNRKKRRLENKYAEMSDELLRIAEESHMQNLIEIGNKIQKEMKSEYSKRSPAKYRHPQDYAHRYLYNGAELVATVRGETVHTIYHKGLSYKDDRFVAWFNNDIDSIDVQSTLNGVGDMISKKVGITGVNVWKSFRLANGDSIYRLDL